MTISIVILNHKLGQLILLLLILTRWQFLAHDTSNLAMMHAQYRPVNYFGLARRIGYVAFLYLCARKKRQLHLSDKSYVKRANL